MSNVGLNFGRFIRTRCLSDPSVQLLHLKRTLGFLRAAKSGGAHMLVIGTKHQTGLNYQQLLGQKFYTPDKITPEIITNAPLNYDLILCFDPIRYARLLHNINLPCVAISRVEDFYHHRDIPDAFDYLLPITEDFLDISKLGYSKLLLISIMSSSVEFELENRRESSDPISENLFLAGKAWEFLTHKVFENEAGSAFLIVAGSVAIAALCGRERRAATLARSLQLGPATSLRVFGHPRYRNHIPQNPLLKH
ncbi:uncharacterized protein TA19140 [Theileria annulata]|uniref:Microprotein domain-containing protein n=1 Tax=Theileria annulata TaxID=5874 RepID=Q4UGA5_THEAN|nr:uncharacterized protein TA19140 [Theileria annulata]CAI73884.1 hypothetical protein, conserved [Theileria annulata]|eukprot:XP_954561.1 hypothetical protein, conserved [Theileria annulata]